MKKKVRNEIVLYDNHAEIILYNRRCEETARALIDLEDVDKVKNIKWCMKSNGYVHDGKIHIHRLIMDCSDNMVVDHINHNKLDNRKTNLRICSHRQNSMNQKTRRDNSSGHAGVGKSGNKWRARIYIDGKEVHLGRFDTKEEAIRARKQAELEHYGEYRNQDED